MRNDGQFSIYSFPSKAPLFQSETTTVLKVYVGIDYNKLVLLNEPVTARLYYGNGIEERVFFLNQILRYGQDLVVDWEWQV